MKLLKKLWAREPVLVSTLVPLAVTAGILTQDQASTVTTTITGAIAMVAQLIAAFTARSVVTSPATAEKAKVSPDLISDGGVHVSSALGPISPTAAPAPVAAAPPTPTP